MKRGRPYQVSRTHSCNFLSQRGNGEGRRLLENRERQVIFDRIRFLIELERIQAWSRDKAHLQDLHLVCFPISLPSRVENWRAHGRWRVSSHTLSIMPGGHNSTLVTFPAPATSNGACGFPALRFPAASS